MLIRPTPVTPDPNHEDPAQAAREANEESILKRNSLNSLLTTIAAYCPDGLFKTILTEATSISWIKARLSQVCNINTTGRHLPKLLEIKFNRDEESPAAFFERIKSSFQDSLMPIRTVYHGRELTTPETFGPTFESMIIILCLKAIHPDLPNFIMDNKGMLFSRQTPNFCDIKNELCDTMDTILAKWNLRTSND